MSEHSSEKFTPSTLLMLCRLALPKLGIGWMFALLTANFNRVAIHELAIPAVAITSMIGFYHYLSPFQIFFGSLADRFPIGGYRRTPYLLFGSLLASTIFLVLPHLMLDMSAGSGWAFALGFLLLIVFGIGLAMSGNAHLALISDVTTDKTRSIAVAMVWTTMIIGLILSAVVMKHFMPFYDFETMVRLYALTPIIVLLFCVMGLAGLETPLSAQRKGELKAQLNAEKPDINIFRVAKRLLVKSRSTAFFFIFIIVSTVGIFLQDTILEVFGAAVLGMSLKETASFQQVWGIGVLASMLLVGILSTRMPLNKQFICIGGSVGVSLGLGLVALSAIMVEPRFLLQILLFLGISTGFYTIGSLTTMMELTTAKERATYMGLWGFAMSLGSGTSGMLAGSLVSGLIETGWVVPATGYAIIFTAEAVLMLCGIWLLKQVSIRAFRRETEPEREIALGVNSQSKAGIKKEDLTLVMEADTGD